MHALRLKATAVKRVAHDDGDLHLAHGCTFYRRWETDALSSNGHKRRAGDVKLAWEVMAKADLESYNIVRNPKYERVMALLDKLGYAAVPADVPEAWASDLHARFEKSCVMHRALPADEGEAGVRQAIEHLEQAHAKRRRR